MGILPSMIDARLRGLWSKDPIEIARFACLQRAVNHHGITAEQLTDAWLKGGSALQELVFGIPDVAATLHGEYLKRRGGLKGKVRGLRCDRYQAYCRDLIWTDPKTSQHQAIAVLRNDSGPEEHLRPIPGT